MRILRAADYRVMPWKNGAGSTTEIAISPPNAPLDDFDWRVSMAQVSADGPFSVFDNIDRTLLVLQGDGIDLSVTGHTPARVDARAIHAFPGDRPASATLINGPVTDLNVMSRRGRVHHHVRRLKLSQPQPFPVRAVTLLIVENGEIAVRSGSASATLAAYDALLLDAHSLQPEIAGRPLSGLIMIQFR
jgi:hypothetical protein